jgi:hypothetical protein
MVVVIPPCIAGPLNGSSQQDCVTLKSAETV